MPSSTRATQPRRSAPPPAGSRRGTLWEEGHHPGRLVARAAVLAILLGAALDVLVTGELSLIYDVVLVPVCVAAALWVRPRDFFTVGVLPPLLLLGTVLLLTFVDRDAVARAGDPVGQAVVTGLAHHAIALVVAYGLTLAVLALRQVALRNHGAIRPKAARRPAARHPQPTQEPLEAGPAASAPVVPVQRHAEDGDVPVSREAAASAVDDGAPAGR